MNCYRMILMPLALLLAVCAQAIAQMDVRLEASRRDYILGETPTIRITIINHTDSTVTLNSVPGRCWLYLTVTRVGDGSPMGPSVPISVPDIKVMPGSRKVYTMGLQPFYRLSREGTYRVVATLRMPDMRTTYGSNTASFNLMPGSMVRSYNVQARGQRLQMNVRMLRLDGKTLLFGQVVDPETRIAHGACMLAQYLNFMEPKVLLDRAQNLHLLCQSSAEFFTYAVMDTHGVRREWKAMKRTGGPVDLISTGSGIRCIGLAPYVKNTNPNSHLHSATERP